MTRTTDDPAPMLPLPDTGERIGKTFGKAFADATGGRVSIELWHSGGGCWLYAAHMDPRDPGAEPVYGEEGPIAPVVYMTQTAYPTQLDGGYAPYDPDRTPKGADPGPVMDAFIGAACYRGGDEEAMHGEETGGRCIVAADDPAAAGRALGAWALAALLAAWAERKREREALALAGGWEGP